MYQIEKSSSADRFYVGEKPGENAACSPRQDVAEVIATFLNSLPSDIAPIDIIKAFGGGKPYGNLSLPDCNEKPFFVDKVVTGWSPFGTPLSRSRIR